MFKFQTETEIQVAYWIMVFVSRYVIIIWSGDESHSHQNQEFSHCRMSVMDWQLDVVYMPMSFVFGVLEIFWDNFFSVLPVYFDSIDL